MAIRAGDPVGDDEYMRLLELRNGLRRFLRWSEDQAAHAGLTAAQHQLLLAVRGSKAEGGPTMSDLADQLLVRHHSAVGLVDRAERAGLVRRAVDAADHRIARVRLTATGQRRLRRLAAAHLEELARLAPQLRPVWEGLEVESMP